MIVLLLVKRALKDNLNTPSETKILDISIPEPEALLPLRPLRSQLAGIPYFMETAALIDNHFVSSSESNFILFSFLFLVLFQVG